MKSEEGSGKRESFSRSAGFRLKEISIIRIIFRYQTVQLREPNSCVPVGTQASKAWSLLILRSFLSVIREILAPRCYASVPLGPSACNSW